MPKYSIIIPVYNVAPYLRECLDSVLAQTFTDWECLCVNDGSTDASGAILDEYAKKDPRFRVFHKPNGGVSSARNLGLDNAKGEWTGFLDGDDIWTPHLLQLVSEALMRNPSVEVVRFQTKTFNSNALKFVPENKKNATAEMVEDVSNGFTFTELTCSFASKIYHRGLIKNVRFAQYIVGEDLLFLVQCILASKAQLALDWVGYGYRMREGSVTHSRMTKQNVLDRISFTFEILNILSNSHKKAHREIIKAFLNKYFELVYVTARRLPYVNRREVLHCWSEKFLLLKSMSIVVGFQRIRLMFLMWFPFEWVAFLLCNVPHKLKTMGIKHFWRR